MQAPVQGRATGDALPLKFNGILLIAGAGTVERDLLVKLADRAEGLVGADRGGDLLIEAGLVPDAVIGDLDSVADPSGFPGRTRVIALPEQDTTDFEKCLYCTSAPVTVALGMTGERFDHTLAALHVVARYAAKGRRIVLIDEHDLAYGIAGSMRIRVGKGARISIYPLGRTRFLRSTGLLYPLDGLEMEQGKAIGTSNQAIADVISIEVAPGVQDPWLLILDRGLLDPVLAGILEQPGS
ncbi:MAG TPA: thiamine diphosphokinase [Pelagibacterium sp.]|uniref:thiamine diphosphokinase n=1 Tax=Pelagibacterium sp. TaxID=1967288 RepID=UPI002B58C4AE|nr:thiamine diphosphokinase [Pelagibacterium sp.]HWJ86951.1 thiamine diphosphokinase [Pelagibacterium sp.]